MAIYSYNYQAKLEILSSNGYIDTLSTSLPANGKLFYDNDVPITADYDFGAYLAENESPLHTVLKFYNDDGFKIALDGDITHKSTNKFMEVWMEYADVIPPAPPKINIETTVKAEMKVLAFSDALP